MAAKKYSTPSGTRDFSPVEMVRRNYIFDTIKKVFRLYGYQPLETPAMENAETLLGKYGDEGDKLIFRILDSGDYLKYIKKDLREKLYLNTKSTSSNKWERIAAHILDEWKSHEIVSKLSEKALRYDLTVPFARYVVQHQNEITFPFRRYQVQPVWRGDRPQKGRYREFYQCDADVIGSNSLLNETELVQVTDEVFTQLGIPVTIKINNRKILAGIAEAIGEKDKTTAITAAIDKLDKAGEQKVVEELIAKGLSPGAVKKLLHVFSFKGNTSEKLKTIRDMIGNSETGKKGIEEVETLFAMIARCHLKTAIYELDITLARGLDYYTGAIFEVKSNVGKLSSSISGGGRYDDLTGIFGLPGISGVGISFGIDRIFDLMNELILFDAIDYTRETTRLMFAHLGEAERNFCISLALQARGAGINTEIYPDIVKKIGKQFDYANKKSIPYVVVVGSDEMNTGKLTLKNMNTGEQEKMGIEEIIEKIK